MAHAITSFLRLGWQLRNISQQQIPNVEYSTLIVLRQWNLAALFVCFWNVPYYRHDLGTTVQILKSLYTLSWWVEGNWARFNKKAICKALTWHYFRSLFAATFIWNFLRLIIAESSYDKILRKSQRKEMFDLETTLQILESFNT